MFKRILSLLMCITLIFTMSLCLGACKNSDDENFPVTISGVTIEEEPQNIVVLSSELADIISYIGYDTKMVGKSNECTHKYFERIPSVGSKSSPNIKSIIELETDLVITDTALSGKDKKKLEEADIKVVTLQNVKDLNKLQPLYVNIGTMLGGKVAGKAEAQKAYTELFDHLADFKDNIPNDIVTTACYLYFNENNELCTLTKGSLEYNTFAYCGALNTFATQEKPQVNLEQLKFGTPSYIFYDDPAVLEYLKSNADLSDMSAVVNGNTMLIKKSAFSHLGITLYDTIYNMIDFMFIPDETISTPDEIIPQSTPDEITTPSQEASRVEGGEFSE